MPEVLPNQTIIHHCVGGPATILNQEVYDIHYAGHQREKIAWGMVELDGFGGYYVTRSKEYPHCWDTDVRLD